MRCLLTCWDTKSYVDSGFNPSYLSSPSSQSTPHPLFSSRCNNMASSCKLDLYHLHVFNSKLDVYAADKFIIQDNDGVLKLTTCISDAKWHLILCRYSTPVHSVKLTDSLLFSINHPIESPPLSSGMFSTCGFQWGRKERQLLKTPPFPNFLNN